jgi:serine phosphatase RsbU (regulator of sigma subunit)
MPNNMPSNMQVDPERPGDVLEHESRALPYAQAALAAAITAGVFAIAMIWILSTVQTYRNLQHRIAEARTARSATLKVLLDMETGVRGYALTRRTVFLQPYVGGTQQMNALLDDQQRELLALGAEVPPTTLGLVDRERAAFQTWRSQFAAPLVTNPGRRDAKRLQIAGKTLVDRFRTSNDSIADRLQTASENADAGLQTALSRIALLGFIGFLVIAGAAWAITIRVERAQREAQRHRELYEIEKHTLDALIKAFVPTQLPTLAGVELSAVYLPAEREALVGGDWFDALALPDGRLFVSVGDVGGHGIAAAVTMSRARQALLTLAVNEETPSVMLARVNQLLNLQAAGMVTAICGFVTSDRRSFLYSAAGHPPPAFVSASGKARFLELGGVPMGVIDDPSYTTWSVETRPGTVIVLYTDGLTESGRDLPAGEERLLATAERLERHPAVEPAGAIRDGVLAQGRALDDVAVLTLTFTQAGVLAENMPNEAACRSPLVNSVDQPHLDPAAEPLGRAVAQAC